MDVVNGTNEYCMLNTTYTLWGVGGGRGRGRVIETVIVNLSRVRNGKKQLQFSAFKTYNQFFIWPV